MADLDNLTLTVEATSSEAASAIESLTKSLKGLQGALGSLDTKNLSGLTSGLTAAKNAVKNTGLSSYSKQLKEQSKALERFKRSVSFTKGFAGAAWKGAKKTITGVHGALNGLSNMFGLGTLTSSKFIKSLARIAGYRFIRGLISGITNSTTTGLENLARASSEANATLSQLSSGALTLQNAMGGALYSVLASIIGVLNSIISAAVSAINWISMLFSILGGRATFKKATSATKEYAGALGSAGGAAEALKQELMGFDEINSLSPDTGGGGGGGGGGMLDYGSMFEEVPVSESLKEMVEKADFTLLGEALADKINSALGKIDWSRIQTGAWKLARSLVTFLNGFIREVKAPLIGDAIAGLINTGVTFVNTFAYDTDWETLGNKIKDAIITAIMKIPPNEIGRLIRARLNIAIGVFTGLLPKTGEEWSQITDWVADSINASIEAVNKDAIGEVVGRIVTGGLQLIISLGEAGTFSNITSKVAEAIKVAIGEVSEEDIRDAAKTVIEEALKSLKILLDLVIDIGDTILGKGLTSYALYRVISGGMKNLGFTGYKTVGNSLAITGALVFAFDALAGISDILENSETMTGTDLANKVADILGSVLTSAGFVLIRTNPIGGAIAVGLGLAIKLFASIELEDHAYELEQISEVFGETGLAAITSATSVEELKNAFTQLSGMTVSTDVFDALLRAAGGLEGATPTIEQYRSAMINLFSAFSDLSLQGDMTNVTTFINELMTTLGVYETAANSAGNATDGFSEATGGITNAAGEIEIAATDVAAAANDISNAQTEIDNINASMQATGEQAEVLATKIISIPSDIVYNLELNNYETVISQFDTLASTISTAGSTGASGFQTAFSGLPGWFESSVVNPIKSKATGINWYSIGNQAMTAFKRGLKSVSMPKFSVSWSTATNTGSIFGKQYSVSIPYPSISIYAAGGFPDVGEIFVANEAGPELVGRIGNKPAVANQEQIGDAIFRYMDAHEQQGGSMNYDSLANAMVRAMKSAGLGALYLDGRQIKQSLNREAQRSGKPVAGY